MRCYECSTGQTGEARDAVGICHHCSAALCADHALMTVDPVITHVAIGQEVILPKVARLLLCRTCKAALEQQPTQNAE
jgi:hypothetical protein